MGLSDPFPTRPRSEAGRLFRVLDVCLDTDTLISFLEERLDCTDSHYFLDRTFPSTRGVWKAEFSQWWFCRWARPPFVPAP
jgi:hypothetical protein